MSTQLVTGAGRPREVSDDEILKVFKESGEHFLTTAEVAEELPIERRGTYKRLDALADSGSLGKKKVGTRGTGWWLLQDE